MLAFLTYSPVLPILNEPIDRGWDGACWPPTEWSADRRQLCRLALQADMALRLCNTCSLLAVLLAPFCAKGPWPDQLGFGVRDARVVGRWGVQGPGPTWFDFCPVRLGSVGNAVVGRS